MDPTLRRFHRDSDPDAIHAALVEDGAVIVEGLLGADVVARVNDEVEAAVAADPDGPMFNPVLEAFHGAQTRQVAGMPGVSRTFASEVMCAPLLLELADRVLLPACARYQLNIGHLLQRGPGAEDQLLHRDELVWSDVPRRDGMELQLASVIAFVDFTRANGATRLVPGSHRWPDRARSPVEQMMQGPPSADRIAYAEMPAGSAVVYTGGVIHGGGANTTTIPRRGAHLSYCLGWLRTEENNTLAVPPAKAALLPRRAQELLGYAVYDAISRGGGYLGMVRLQDPVDLLARGAL